MPTTLAAGTGKDTVAEALADTAGKADVVSATPDSGLAAPDEVADASDESGRLATRGTAQVNKPDHSQMTPISAELPDEASLHATVTGGVAQPVSPTSSSSAVPDATAKLIAAPLASLKTSTAPTQTFSAAAVTSTAPAVAPPVTLATIVTDVLTWMGLGPLETHIPVPTWSVGPIMQSLWLAVRELQDRLTATPVAASTVAAASPLVPQGVTPDPLELADLGAQPGVSVNLNTDGSIDIIDGTFTDATITSATDAAELFNRLAPLLGASSGFASPANIIVQKIGQTSTAGDIPEIVYRVRDSLQGIPVLGSEAVLVTDGTGAVTGLFNNLDRLGGIDVALDARVDQGLEANAFAAAAYLNSTAALQSGLPSWALLLSSRFDPELVVYALDPNAPPRLAWQVTVAPPQRFLAPPDPSVTYYISATGADAGTVMLATSAAQGASTTATDTLGQVRTIDVTQQTYFFFFQVMSLRDVSRNIATYGTAASSSSASADRTLQQPRPQRMVRLEPIGGIGAGERRRGVRLLRQRAGPELLRRQRRVRPSRRRLRHPKSLVPRHVRQFLLGSRKPAVGIW